MANYLLGVGEFIVVSARWRVNKVIQATIYNINTFNTSKLSLIELR